MSTWQKPPLGTILNPGHPLARGLVGCWVMNEGAGDKVHDLSGNNWDGTFAGTAAWTPGMSGDAVTLDGDSDYIALGDSSDDHLNFNQGTVSCWYKKHDATAGGDIFSFSDNGDVGTFYLLRLSGSATHVIQSWIRLPTPNDDYVWSGTYISDTKWHHIAVVKTASSTIIYFDGQDTAATVTLDDAGAADATTWWDDLISSAAPAERATIGALGRNTYSAFFPGIIDHQYIYNRALSAQEVAQLYQSPYQMFDTIPLWQMVSGAAAATSLPVFDYYHNQVRT